MYLFGPGLLFGPLLFGAGLLLDGPGVLLLSLFGPSLLSLFVWGEASVVEVNLDVFGKPPWTNLVPKGRGFVTKEVACPAKKIARSTFRRYILNI